MQPLNRQAALDELARLRAAHPTAVRLGVEAAAIDALIATPDPRDLGEIRGELIGQLADEIHARAAACAAEAVRESAQRAIAIAQLATAIAAIPAEAPVIDATYSVDAERLAADVWTATQEAGYGTQFGDVAAEAVRKVLA